MIIDHIPADTQFSSHTQADGSNIGGMPPVWWSGTPIPGKHRSWLFETSGSTDKTGKGFPAVEFYPAKSSFANDTAIGRPILPNSGNLQLCFDLLIDDRAVAAAHVFETDIILVISGLKYNFSGQRHNVTGQIDIGNWTDTGLRLGMLTPNRRHKVKWTYGFGKEMWWVVSYECDSIVSPINSKPTSATTCNWPDGAYNQFQLGSLPGGLPWAMRIGRPRHNWW